MVLQERSWAGLESRSQAVFCCLSAVRQRTSRVCTPSPQDREHALHSVVNHCGVQGCSSHGCTGDGFSRCEHSLAALTVKSLPVFLTQMMSLRWVPLPHAALHCPQGPVYQRWVGVQGPPLQAFISAGFSPAHFTSLSPLPTVKHTTSLRWTPGPHVAEQVFVQSVKYQLVTQGPM